MLQTSSAGWAHRGDRVIALAWTEIEELALSYGLMSDYTSFVAVDAAERTAGDHGTTVKVPVPIPAGVRYDTAVGDR